MADLDFRAAQSLAASLVTIGHPYAQVAIDATAADLVNWCKGLFVRGRIIDPEEQAQRLVTEARLTWKEGWPDKAGTSQLHDLFREMFEPSLEGERKPFETPPPPSCEKCSDTGWEVTERRGYEYSKLCTACGGKRRPATVCPDCGSKETKLVKGKREWCKCVTPERRALMREWFAQLTRDEEAS